MDRVLKNLFLALALSAVALAGCARALPPQSVGGPIPAAAQTVAVPVATPVAVAEDPGQVVRAFYTWYIAYAGGPEHRSPLQDGSYREHDVLTPAFVAEIEQATASFDKGGADPILCGQDVPQEIEVSPAEIAGERAHVAVHTSFFAHSLQVRLVQRAGSWRIDGVQCPSSAPPTEDPERLVTWFYQAYLDYAGNPLVTRAFVSRAYMSEAFIQRMEHGLSAMNQGGADPILCAQNVPESFRVESTLVAGETAEVTLSTSFPGHRLVVWLLQNEGCWKIESIRRAG